MNGEVTQLQLQKLVEAASHRWDGNGIACPSTRNPHQA